MQYQPQLTANDNRLSSKGGEDCVGGTIHKRKTDDTALNAAVTKTPRVAQTGHHAGAKSERESGNRKRNQSWLYSKDCHAMRRFNTREPPDALKYWLARGLE